MMPRTLVIDIETAPLELLGWKLFDENFSLDQIKVEWNILSYAAKWIGEKKVFYECTGGRGRKKVRDDRCLMQGMWNLLDEADIVVGQNHKKFDLKKINARLIEHGFGPYAPFKVVDTTIEARRYFAFTSRKLAWMSSHLTDTPKDDHKEFPGFELWKECLIDNPKAWRQMKKYNVRDVEATEKVYVKLLPWISTHPNAAVFIEDKERRCPKCGSKRMDARGYALTQQGMYQRFQCQGCGGWARGKQQQLATNVRKNLLVGV